MLIAEDDVYDAMYARRERDRERTSVREGPATVVMCVWGGEAFLSISGVRVSVS